jgi:hypothetical protein
MCDSDADDRLAELVMGLAGCDEATAADALSATDTAGDVDRLLWSARALTLLRNRG